MNSDPTHGSSHHINMCKVGGGRERDVNRQKIKYEQIIYR